MQEEWQLIILFARATPLVTKHFASWWRREDNGEKKKSSIQKYYKQKLLDILRKKCLIQQHERKKERKKRASAAVFCFVFIRHQKRPPVGQRDVVAKSHVKVGMERALYNRDKHTHTHTQMNLLESVGKSTSKGIMKDLKPPSNAGALHHQSLLHLKQERKKNKSLRGLKDDERHNWPSLDMADIKCEATTRFFRLLTVN